MTITPDCNIDYVSMNIINQKEVSKKTFRTTEEITIYDLMKQEEKTINVNNVSIFTNLLILDGERYKILSMLSK